MDKEIKNQALIQVRNEMSSNIKTVMSDFAVWLDRPDSSGLSDLYERLSEVSASLNFLGFKQAAILTDAIITGINVLEKDKSLANDGDGIDQTKGSEVASALLVLEDFVSRINSSKDLDFGNIKRSYQALETANKKDIDIHDLEIFSTIEPNTFQIIFQNISEILSENRQLIEQNKNKSISAQIAEEIINKNNELNNLFAALDMIEPQLLLLKVNDLISGATSQETLTDVAEAMLLVESAFIAAQSSHRLSHDDGSDLIETQKEFNRQLVVEKVLAEISEQAVYSIEHFRKKVVADGKITQSQDWRHVSKHLAYYQSVISLTGLEKFSEVLKKLGTAFSTISLHEGEFQDGLFAPLIDSLVGIEYLCNDIAINGQVNEYDLQFLITAFKAIENIFPISEAGKKLFNKLGQEVSDEDDLFVKSNLFNKLDEGLSALEGNYLPAEEFNEEDDELDEEETEEYIGATLIEGEKKDSDQSTNTFASAQYIDKDDSRLSEMEIENTNENNISNSEASYGQDVNPEYANEGDNTAKAQPHGSSSYRSSFGHFYDNKTLSDLNHLQIPPEKVSFIESHQNAVVDEEIREFFLEDFEENMAVLAAQLPLLKSEPHEFIHTQEIRRVFHTLKGSGRMVGYEALGEFAWQHEQLLNHVLDNHYPVNTLVIDIVTEAYHLLTILGQDKQFEQHLAALLQQALIAEKARQALLEDSNANIDQFANELRFGTQGISSSATGEAISSLNSKSKQDGDLELDAAEQNISGKNALKLDHHSDSADFLAESVSVSTDAQSLLSVNDLADGDYSSEFKSEGAQPNDSLAPTQLSLVESEGHDGAANLDQEVQTPPDSRSISWATDSHRSEDFIDEIAISTQDNTFIPSDENEQEGESDLFTLIEDDFTLDDEETSTQSSSTTLAEENNVVDSDGGDQLTPAINGNDKDKKQPHFDTEELAVKAQEAYSQETPTEYGQMEQDASVSASKSVALSDDADSDNAIASNETFSSGQINVQNDVFSPDFQYESDGNLSGTSTHESAKLTGEKRPDTSQAGISASAYRKILTSLKQTLKYHDGTNAVDPSMVKALQYQMTNYDLPDDGESLSALTAQIMQDLDQEGFVAQDLVSSVFAPQQVEDSFVAEQSSPSTGFEPSVEAIAKRLMKGMVNSEHDAAAVQALSSFLYTQWQQQNLPIDEEGKNALLSDLMDSLTMNESVEGEFMADIIAGFDQHIKQVESNDHKFANDKSEQVSARAGLQGTVEQADNDDNENNDHESNLIDGEVSLSAQHIEEGQKSGKESDANVPTNVKNEDSTTDSVTLDNTTSKTTASKAFTDGQEDKNIDADGESIKLAGENDKATTISSNNGPSATGSEVVLTESDEEDSRESLHSGQKLTADRSDDAVEAEHDDKTSVIAVDAEAQVDTLDNDKLDQEKSLVVDSDQVTDLDASDDIAIKEYAVSSDEFHSNTKDEINYADGILTAEQSDSESEKIINDEAQVASFNASASQPLLAPQTKDRSDSVTNGGESSRQQRLEEELSHLAEHPTLKNAAVSALDDDKIVQSQVVYLRAVDKLESISEKALQKVAEVGELIEALYDIEDSLEAETAPQWLWRILDAMEHVLIALKDNELEVTQKLTDTFKDSLELIKNYEDHDDEEVEDLISKLMQERKNSEPSKIVDSENKTLLPVSDLMGLTTNELVLDPNAGSSLTATFIDEALRLFATSQNDAEYWAEDLQQFSRLDGIRRNMHTIKGSALMANYVAISDLAHTVESLIESVVEGHVSASPRAATLLIGAMWQGLLMLDDIQDGYLPKQDPYLLNNISSFLNEPLPYPEIEAALIEEKNKEIQLDEYTSNKALSEPIEELSSQENIDLGNDETTEQRFSDAVDPVLVEIFTDEALELIENTYEQISGNLQDEDNIDELKRSLHTLKGGARLVGIFSMGDTAHNMESIVEKLHGYNASKLRQAKTLLQMGTDALFEMLDTLSRHGLPLPVVALNDALSLFAETGKYQLPAKGEQQTAVVEEKSAEQQSSADTSSIESAELEQPLNTSTSIEHTLDNENAYTQKPNPTSVSDSPKEVDAQIEIASSEREENSEQLELAQPTKAPVTDSKEVTNAKGDQSKASLIDDKTNTKVSKLPHFVRVEANLLDELIAMSGEMAILRSRLENLSRGTEYTISELSRVAVRIDEQTRHLDSETEAQMLYSREQYSEHNEEFDPLELDRFSEMQQLSRQLAEAVDDLKSLNDSLQSDNSLMRSITLQQSVLQRNIQNSLMTTQMMRFDVHEPRLKRLIKQTTSSINRDIEFILTGGGVELERRLLEELLPALEHIMRNAIYHGIEPPQERVEKGKPRVGVIKVDVSLSTAELVIRVMDDGRGFDYDRIRQKAAEKGFLDETRQNDQQYLSSLIFKSGFSTAESLTQISGRGVGMDVVNDIVRQRRGRVSAQSIPGKGSEFVITMPFSMSISEVLLVEIADQVYAVPMSSITAISQVSIDKLHQVVKGETVYERYNNFDYKLVVLGGYFSPDNYEFSREENMLPVLFVNSGSEAIGFHIDRILNRVEIVVKSVNNQLLNIPGISGATILGDGSVVPVLELLDLSRRIDDIAIVVKSKEPKAEVKQAAILVVDDSVTMRKVATRLLERNDYLVVTAKDGLDAIEVLQEFTPDLILLDIEMPRMDGFEFATHVRQTEALQQVPIIMITSRTGNKHRERADKIGVQGYLGKPYREDILIESIKNLLGENGND